MEKQSYSGSINKLLYNNAKLKQELKRSRNQILALKSELQTANEGWEIDRTELKKIIRENIELSKLDIPKIVMTLRNSGAFDLDWEKLSAERMQEIWRKEGVIRDKDDKVTRLIRIIREKNSKIKELKKHQESVVSVNNKATAECDRGSQPSLWRASVRGKPNWEDWIKRRFEAQS